MPESTSCLTASWQLCIRLELGASHSHCLVHSAMLAVGNMSNRDSRHASTACRLWYACEDMWISSLLYSHAAAHSQRGLLPACLLRQHTVTSVYQVLVLEVQGLHLVPISIVVTTKSSCFDCVWEWCAANTRDSSTHSTRMTIDTC